MDSRISATGERRGDVDRATLLDDFKGCGSKRRTPTLITLSLLEQARAKAKLLDEGKWVLFFDHWILQTQLFFRRDYRNLLDQAVKASIEACKPGHRDLPQRVCIHEDLIHAYVGIDPVGYADRIAAALDFMKGEAHPKAECQHCILGCRASFESEMGRYDASREIGEEKLRKALDGEATTTPRTPTRISPTSRFAEKTGRRQPGIKADGIAGTAARIAIPCRLRLSSIRPMRCGNWAVRRKRCIAMAEPSPESNGSRFPRTTSTPPSPASTKPRGTMRKPCGSAKRNSKSTVTGADCFTTSAI
ncbi:MAG: hypothetical protein U0744_04075 [Gemmataceae bacterium]